MKSKVMAVIAMVATIVLPVHGGINPIVTEVTLESGGYLCLDGTAKVVTFTIDSGSADLAWGGVDDEGNGIPTDKIEVRDSAGVLVSSPYQVTANGTVSVKGVKVSDALEDVHMTLTGHHSDPVSDVKKTIKFTVIKVDIKAENGTDAPVDGLCVDTTKKFKAVVTPAIAGAYSWSTTSAKFALADASSQTVTVNAGADESSAVDAEDLKVEFTPTGGSTTCDDTHDLTVVKVDVTDLQTTPYLPGTDNPADATSMGDDVTVTYRILPSGYTVDLAGLYMKDKDDNVVYNDMTITKSGGPHDVIWSVSENSLRSVNSDKDPYKAEVTIRANWTYDDDSKDLAITESEVTVVAETSTTTGNPVQECMEGRWITFTATASGFVSDSPSHTIDFTFHYTKADGTTWDDTDWSFDLIEDNTAVADDVPAGDVDHFFETPITVSVSDDYTHTATSPEIKIKVYELWIDYFRDATTDKAWKVVVGENIEYKAIASADCGSWDWDMEDGVPDKWNPAGGNAKQGGAMKIPYSDLSGAHNSWFGEAYGTVSVFCEDEEGNNHHFYSTSMTPSKKAQVFFDPDLNVDGAAPTTAKPPCWFVFWKDGVVVDGISEFGYQHVTGWGMYNGNLYLRKDCRGTGNVALTITRLDGTTFQIHVPQVKHLDQVAGTIVHEKYHEHCDDTWGGMGVRPGHTDADGLPDTEENTPTSHDGVAFPASDPGNVNSLGFPNYIGTYEDQEVRCRIKETDKPQTTYPDKDWSKTSDNPKW